MHQGPIRERLILAIEIADKGQIDRRLFGAVQVYLDMSLLGKGRPDSPDDTRSFHLREDQLVAIFANDAGAVTVGRPVKILARRLVVLAAPVVARPLHALLARLR